MTKRILHVVTHVGQLVPYNVEEDMRERGALYEKTKLPSV